MKTVDLIDRALRKLPRLSLLMGGHDYPVEYARSPGERAWVADKGTCLMEAVAFISREQHSDHPKCTAYVLSDFGISINDACPNDRFRNKVLKPVIPVLLNTSSKRARDGFEVDDKHNRKVEQFLRDACIEKFGLDKEKNKYRNANDILETEICNTTYDNRKRCKVLRIAADILRDAACFAREQLGPDVDYPVKPVFLNKFLVKESEVA